MTEHCADYVYVRTLIDVFEPLFCTYDITSTIYCRWRSIPDCIWTNPPKSMLLDPRSEKPDDDSRLDHSTFVLARSSDRCIYSKASSRISHWFSNR
jgi:hypothetical protein